MLDIWTQYEVTMDFCTKLVASVPADPDMVTKWLESRQPRNRPPDSRSITEIAQEVIDTLPPEGETEESGLLVFQRREGGLVVRMTTIRAHLKDCAQVLSRLYVGKIEKESSFAVKVKNAVYYPPQIYWLPILSQEDDKQIKEPAGRYDRGIHATTPRGQINALKTLEYVENARLKVPLWILTNTKGKPVIPVDDLETLLVYGGTHGYGGERSAGEGRYFATIEEVKFKWGHTVLRSEIAPKN